MCFGIYFYPLCWTLSKTCQWKLMFIVDHFPLCVCAFSILGIPFICVLNLLDQFSNFPFLYFFFLSFDYVFWEICLFSKLFPLLHFNFQGFLLVFNSSFLIAPSSCLMNSTYSLNYLIVLMLFFQNQRYGHLKHNVESENPDPKAYILFHSSNINFKIKYN